MGKSHRKLQLDSSCDHRGYDDDDELAAADDDDAVAAVGPLLWVVVGSCSGKSRRMSLLKVMKAQRKVENKK